MLAEFVALVSCCCEQLLTTDIIDLIGLSHSLSSKGTVKEHFCIYKNNARASMLINTKKLQNTYQWKLPIYAAKPFYMKLKSKKCYCLWNEIGDSMLNVMPIAPPIIKYLPASPLSILITFATNNCWYSGAVTEIFVTMVHVFFLKAKSEASKEDDPNWHQAISGPFVDEYWKVAEKDISTLEEMGIWDVMEFKVDTNIIDGTWAFQCKQFTNGTVKNVKTHFVLIRINS